jgi:sugar/nucleoside kinase (ribokinase family)
MADLLVVGSVALDSVETPFGKVQEALGGSATYFSYSASFFAPVHLVATVGDDFPEAHLKLLEDRGVDIRGLQTSRGRTFRWTGQYGYDLNEAKTLETQLNVFAEFRPVLNDVSGRTPFLFLANIDPELQLDVLRQMKERPKLVALDTMNFWIQGKREALRKVLAEVDIVTVNDGEARQLASEPNLIRAARAISAMGPKTVVVKRGEYGALLSTEDRLFFVPAYPLESVYDPTGAGDTFAGGFMGYVAAHAGEELTDELLRTAMAYGTALASFNVEAFGTERMQTLTGEEITARVNELQRISAFAPAPLELRA